MCRKQTPLSIQFMLMFSLVMCAYGIAQNIEHDEASGARKLLSSISYDNWIKPLTPLLPTANYFQSTGYSSQNDTIWLLGGARAPKQLIAFNPSNHTFTDHGNDSLPFEIIGISTQIEDHVYINNGSDLFRFNVNTATLEHFQWIPYNVRPGGLLFPSRWGCLTSISHRYLLIAGGSASGHGSFEFDDVFILDLNDNSWIANVPRMLTAKWNCRCITNAAADTLYVTGGGYETVEVLDVSDLPNIQHKNWFLLTSELSSTMMDQTMLRYEDDILCIGGYWCCEAYVQQMNIIDTTTNTVSQQPNPAGLYGLGIAAIIVANIAYLFGGKSHGEVITGYMQTGYRDYYFDTWSYMVLPSSSPTNTPSKDPSHPTFNPTFAPTSFTQMPSIPSVAPSKNPTIPPTLAPSLPSLNPTFRTASPTITSLDPSTTPTSSPSVLLHTQSSVHLQTEYESSNSKLDVTTLYILAAISGVVIIVIAAVAVACFVTKRKRQQSATQDTQFVTETTGNQVNQQNMKNENENDKSSEDESIEQMYVNKTTDIGVNVEKLDAIEYEGYNKNELVRIWLTTKVGLPQYYPFFMLNGYESLDFISKIKDENKLMRIGIVLQGHLTQIMAEIEVLQQAEVQMAEIEGENDRKTRTRDGVTNTDLSKEGLAVNGTDFGQC
eukprot:113640_1